MRIAVGGYSHETNSFSNLPVTETLLNNATQRGGCMRKQNEGVRSGIGGFYDVAKRLGIELVPAIYAGLVPSAPAQRRAYEQYRDLLVQTMWEAHCQAPLDGIALCLHGAGIAEGYDDLEADLLKALRERFGDRMPIGMELDLHANVTEEMIRLCDITVGFKYYPHVDQYECGCTVMELLHRMIQTGKRPCTGYIKLPWLIAPTFGQTLSGPARDIQQKMLSLTETDAALLDTSFFHGFGYADVPFAGVSVVTVADDQASADRCAHTIASYAWSRRGDFSGPINSAEQAMDLAEQAEYPVVINESSDNPGGGTPGDGTHLLREMLRRNLPGSAFGMIRDCEVVDQAINAGVGNRISCLLGGKTDQFHGAPIEIKDAYIKTISDGSFIQQNPMGKGAQENLGPTVLLIVGNVQIVVTKARTQTKDDGPFRIVGIDWQQMRILALKSTQHFRGWWQDRAKTIIPCDSPGIQSADLTSYPFTKLDMGQFPFCDAQWE